MSGKAGWRAPPQRLLAVLLAVAQCLAVKACTSSMYADPETKTVASWRHMDLPVLYFNQIAWVPKGMNLRAIPVANKGSNLTYSSTGPTYPVKYSYVCVTSSRAILETWMDVLIPGSQLNRKTSPGICSEGLNTAGLGVSSQMQDSSTGINLYKGHGPAVEQAEALNYILATYSSVAEVKAALVAGTLNLVLNPSLSSITQRLFGSSFFLQHYGLYDAFNESLVIEFSGPTNIQWFDNELGVLANNPLYEEQVAYYNAWLNHSASQAYFTMHNSSYYEMPGAFNSSERFTKAAMLKLPALLWRWPKDIVISPAFVAPGVPSNNANLMTNVAMAGNLFLPKGVDDAGGIQIPGGLESRDITLWTTLKDHTYRVFYYKVANNPMWKRIALSNVRWSKLGGIKYASMEPGVWWQDKTYDKV